MTERSQPEPHGVQKVGRALAFVFSLIIIAVIAFFVLDEANARFGVLAISVAIVAMTRPVAIVSRLGRARWLVDIGLVAAFLYSAIWFFRVKQELYNGFYMATTENVVAGLLGLISLVALSVRAWGWSLAIMAMIFVAFGFAGPSLPGILQHFGMEIGGFLQIAWYSFDGVFGRVTAWLQTTS